MSQHLDAYKTSGSSPPRRVNVTNVQITPGCTVALGEGLDECGRAVPFAGDWRPMLLIAQELAAGRRVEVWLDGHEIVSWNSSEAER